MAGTKLLGGSALSTFCVFDQRLGSDDENATLNEQADRILYYYPPALPLREQLRHIGMLQGLIAFSKSLSPGSGGCRVVHLSRRRYAFYEPEPDIWVVGLLVNQELASVSAAQFAGTTDSYGWDAPSPSGGTFSTSQLDDNALRELVGRVYGIYETFYGQISRVLRQPAAASVIQRIADLRTTLRKRIDKAAAVSANLHYRSAAVLAASTPIEIVAESLEGAERATASQIQSAPSAEVVADDFEERRLRAIIDALEAVSPIAAVRSTLAHLLGFLLHYTDWANILPLDFTLPLRCHPPRPQARTALQAFTEELLGRVPHISRVAVLVDGQVVAGRPDAAFSSLHHFLRLYSFHLLKGSYSAPPKSRRDADEEGDLLSRAIGVQQAAFVSSRAVGVGPGSSSPYSTGSPAARAGHTSLTGGASTASSAWSTSGSVASVSQWLTALQDDVRGLLVASPLSDLAVCAGLSVPSPPLPPIGAAYSFPGHQRIPPASSAEPQRILRPAAMATASLPAAAERIGQQHSVHCVATGGDAQILSLPFVSSAYLEALTMLQAPKARVLGVDLTDEGVSAPLNTVEKGRQSTGCIGPAMPVRPHHHSSLTSLRTQVEPHLRAVAAAAAATTTRSIENTASDQRTPAHLLRIFAPAVFTDTTALEPSHRLLWFQYGLLTVIVLLDASSLDGLNNVASPDLATSTCAARDEDASDTPELAEATGGVVDVCSRLAPSVEALVLAGLDEDAIATQSVMADGTLAITWKKEFHAVDALSFRGLSRIPRAFSGGGMQAVAVPSSVVAAEVPRHVLVAWALALKDSTSYSANVKLRGGLLNAGQISGPDDTIAASCAGETLAALVSLASDKRAASVYIAAAVRRRAAAVNFASPNSALSARLVPDARLPTIQTPLHCSTLLATRYDGAVAAISRNAARDVTFVLSVSTPDPASNLATRAAELHRGYFGDTTVSARGGR
jgi:hypothetical protein